MKYLFLILLFAVSCKKKETEAPKESATIEVYCKSGNSNVNSDALETIMQVNYSKTYIVNDPEIQVYVKNNLKSSNDSINIKVTYKGVTKQKGSKCVNTLNMIGFQLSTF